jgi:hypothetical protein
MGKDPTKARERKRRYLERQKIKKYGPDAAGLDMRGRHGNHARGQASGRWNDGRMISTEGYVLIRVGKDHPLAIGNGYAYEHHLIWAAAGRAMPEKAELIHHKNEDKTDNRLDNLELKTRVEHAILHSQERGRDALGRFPPKAATA